MKISIIGTNGMLSTAFTKYYFAKESTTVETYGLEAPNGYDCDKYHHVDLNNDKLDYETMCNYDVIIYAAGAGVQAAQKTDSSLMYALNVSVPIEITLQLKKHDYKGIYISFGSYMEIGINKEEEKKFTEEDVIYSKLPVSNDYGLSKRLYGRYIMDFTADFSFYHFILPNMFSEDDLKPGTRLIPYTLQYLKNYKNRNNPQPPNYSSGLQTRQFITLEEMIQTVDKAIERKILSGIYNIGGGEFLSIRELIERLFSLYGVTCKDEFFGKEVRRDGDIKSLCIDGGKLFNALGSLPSSTIEEIFKKK